MFKPFFSLRIVNTSVSFPCSQEKVRAKAILGSHHIKKVLIGHINIKSAFYDKISEQFIYFATYHRRQDFFPANSFKVSLCLLFVRCRFQSIESSKRIGRLVREACKGMDVIVIASSDMSHYVPKPIASVNDHALIDRICSMDINGIYDVIRSGVTACGYGPISAMIEAISPANGKLLCYSDSYDALNYQKESVVGYASAIFY